MRVLDPTATRAALPMAEVVRVVRDAMTALGRGAALQPLRTVIGDERLDGVTLVKPAALFDPEPAIAVKLVSVFPGNPDRGMPAINGVVVAVDAATGVPRAVLDGGVATELRTGAASAVATDLLATADAGDLALLGAGVQARAHLAALAEVRDLRRIRVWNHRRQGADRFVDWAARHGWTVEVCDTARDAVEGADLVCTVTSSPTPVLEGAWLADGAHVNAAGAFRSTDRELDTAVIVRADVVVVDSRESAAAESGDLLIPVAEGAVPADVAHPELGELLAAGTSPRTDASQVTVYESLGVAVQDVAAASLAVAIAEAEGLGVEVPWA